MTVCARCQGPVGEALARARAHAGDVESITLQCPHCGAIHQVDARGALTLDGGAIRTPSLLDDLAQIIEEELGPAPEEE